MADSGSPLNMGVPWESLSQLPGDDNAAYGLHLRQAIAPGMAPQQGPSPQRLPGQEELAAALGNMRDFQARLSTTMAAQAVPSPAESISMTTDPTTGQKKVKVETTQENYQATIDSAMKYHQMLGGYAQQLDQIQGRLKAQEENLRAQPPWVQLATALSANLAQAKDMPGWVQGLGATAAQLNPNPDQIEMKRAGLLKEQADLAEKGARIGFTGAAMQESVAQRNEARTQALEAQRRKLVEQATDNLAHAIGQGPGQMDEAAVDTSLKTAGASPDEIQAIKGNLGILAKNIDAKYLRESAKQVADAAAREKEATARDERFNKSQEGLWGRLAEAQAGQDKRQNERMAQQEFTTSNAAYNRTTALSPSEQNAVETAFKTLNLVGKMADLDKSGKKGPITGAIQYLNPWRGAEWQQIMNYSDQMLLSGLNGKLGSGVSDMDVKVMRGIMPNGKMTQEQYDSTVKVLRTLSPENLQRLMILNPNVQYWKNTKPLFDKFGMGDQYKSAMDQMKSANAAAFPELFGPDRPPIADRMFGKDTKFEGNATTSSPPAGAKDSGGLHNKVSPPDEIAAAKAAPINSTVKINGVTYKKRGENDFVEVK
jgi:hypothetical protein